MATEKLTNTAFNLLLDTDRDSFGIEGGFTLEVQDELGNVLPNTGAGVWTEIVRTTFAANSGVVAAAADVGERVISLEAGHTISAGDVVEIGTAGMYAVVAVSGNNIELKRGLEAPVAAADNVDAVGNTGMYRAEVKLNFVGDVSCLVKHPDYGFLAIRYTLVPVNLAMVDEKIDNIAQQIGATKTIRAVL